MADMAERRRNSSGGRLRGCESLSYRAVDDREKGFAAFVGDDDLDEGLEDEDFAEFVRRWRPFSRGSLVRGFFFLSGEVSGVSSGVSGSTAVFFLDLKRFIGAEVF